MPLVLCATAAAAQGPIPFELNDPGEAFQLVEMDLAIHDTELLGTEIDIRTDDRVSTARDQEGAGAESGSLRLLPGALSIGFGAPPFFTTSALDTEGTRPFYELRSPPGSSNHLGVPGLSEIGELIYDSSCDGCAWLEGGLESRAESGFDLRGGTLDVASRVETPDYGVNLEFPGFGSFQHRIFARGIASLNDWIYVTGPASTATVTLVATIDATVEAPVAFGNSEEYWLTQGYGDLRESGFNPGGGLFGLMPATVFQMTNLQVFLELTNWSFEPVCEPIDEEGGEICTDDWVPEVIADATALREREMLLQYEVLETETTTEMLSFDTGPLPPSLTVQATVPTGRWVEVRLSVSSDTECKGAKGCDLDVYTNEPVQLAITAPGATLVAWSGIAGLTAVPEPGAGLSIAAAFAALAQLRTRTRR